MAQAHYVMAYLSFTQEKWSLAVKLYIGAADSFSAATDTINTAVADGMAVSQAFKCAPAQLDFDKKYTCTVALLVGRSHGMSNTFSTMQARNLGPTKKADTAFFCRHGVVASLLHPLLTVAVLPCLM